MHARRGLGRGVCPDASTLLPDVRVPARGGFFSLARRVDRSCIPEDAVQREWRYGWRRSIGQDAFIAYPTNHVVGTIVDPKLAQAAIEALLQVGFARQDIDILHGEEDLHRPVRPGAEHRFLAGFQRTLIQTLADEYKHLQHLVEDVRAGRWVIMVLAKKRDKREAAADILGIHGAESIEFYGRWAWHSLESHPAAPDDSITDPAPGRTYEIHVGGTETRVRLDSESQDDDPSQVRRLSGSLPHPGHASQTTPADDHAGRSWIGRPTCMSTTSRAARRTQS